jgi:DNA-binding NarL/FixJ family response regulator
MQHEVPPALYREAIRGDTAAFAAAAFGWLRGAIAFDAGLLVTTFPDRPAFLDAHFTGFDDPATLMRSWEPVAHLDVLAPQLLAEPGKARRHDMDDPLLAGPEFKPLRDHLERFAFRRSLCLALPQEAPSQATVIILVRHDLTHRTMDADLRRLEAMGPPLSEALVACRSIALLRSADHNFDGLRVARVDARGAFVQTTPAFAQAMWAGRTPQDVHLAPDALRALSQGRAWPLPGRALTLHALPDGGGWLLRLQPTSPADLLSPREREIAHRYARGESHQQIARALMLAPSTVRNHLGNIYSKLQVHHRSGLIEALR